MKFFSYKEIFLKSNRVAAIECNILPGGELIIQTIILKETKSKVEIVESNEFKKIIELKNNIPVDIPVILIVTGKGIIHKKIPVSQNENDKNALHNVLPNADVKDFYLEKHVHADHLFVSVIRKNILDDLLNELKKNKYFILGCSLGPFSLQSIFPLLSESESFEAKINNYHFSVKNNVIDSYKTDEIPSENAFINLGNNSLKQSFALSFSAAFQYLISGEKSFSLQTESIVAERGEYKQKKIFVKSGWVLLATFFAILLINFVLFQYYSDRNSELNSQSILLQSELESFNTVEKKFKEKQDFFRQNGLLETSKTSYYADQIAFDLQPAIRLISLNIFPATKLTEGTNDMLSFKPKVIDISGRCNLSTELNEWIKVLKKKRWVNKVNMIDYHQDNLKTQGQFTIELTIN